MSSHTDGKKSNKKRKQTENSQKDDDPRLKIDLEKIKKLEDMRTCVMIKNLPNKVRQDVILKEIDNNHKGKYNFFYMPVDFNNDNASVGYAFINFIHPLFILDFNKQFNGKRWFVHYNSHKQTELKYGKIQGQFNLMNHFRASTIMRKEDQNMKPRFFEQGDSNQLKEDL